MSDEATSNTVLQFIRDELVVDTNDPVMPETDLLGGGYIDSMGIMRLVAFLESDFEISVPPEHVTIENFETVSKIANYIQSRVGEANV